MIHSKGGFEIRNWQSNSEQVLRNLEAESTRSFVYKLNPTKIKEGWLYKQGKPTKKDKLRTLMAIYDPMGLIASILVNAKLLLQNIWRSAIGWNDEINDIQLE